VSGASTLFQTEHSSVVSPKPGKKLLGLKGVEE